MKSQIHGWCQSCELLFRSQHNLAVHTRNVHCIKPLTTDNAVPLSQRRENILRRGTSSRTDLAPTPPQGSDAHHENADARKHQREQECEETLKRPNQRRRLDSKSTQLTGAVRHMSIQRDIHPKPQATNPNINRELFPKPTQNVTCFGCDRVFKSYASMMLHLEEEVCITTVAQLGQIAADAPNSELYVTHNLRHYLRTEYGKERLAFDTDNISRWECVECRKMFSSTIQATGHAKSPVHKPKVFKCPRCRFEFAALSGVLQHVEQSSLCWEGLHDGTGAMGRLLSEIEQRLHG